MSNQPQQPDTKPGHYYVSVSDGSRYLPNYALLLGPFTTHQAALDMVEAAKKRIMELDTWAHFYAFGTCQVDLGEPVRVGVLNEEFGL